MWVNIDFPAKTMMLKFVLTQLDINQCQEVKLKVA